MTKHKLSFREIREDAKEKCAEMVWDKAVAASKLRHIALKTRQNKSAKNLGKVKDKSIVHIISLSPKGLFITIDNSYQIGLRSIRWPKHGKLHIRSDLILY